MLKNFYYFTLFLNLLRRWLYSSILQSLALIILYFLRAYNGHCFRDINNNNSDIPTLSTYVNKLIIDMITINNGHLQILTNYCGYILSYSYKSLACCLILEG